MEYRLEIWRDNCWEEVEIIQPNNDREARATVMSFKRDLPSYRLRILKVETMILYDTENYD